MATSFSKQMCLVVGTPRGFTRSVLEALLKRGSKVVLTCSNQSVAQEEHRRLSSLYGSGQIFYTPCDQSDERQLETVFLRAIDNLGEISFIVHSTANDPLEVSSDDITGDVKKVNKKLDRILLKQDVEGLKRLGHLATKYMGKHNGWQGGTLLNISSSTELTPGVDVRSGQCTVLGTTRALGLVSGVERTGVRVCNVYHPGVDYTDLNLRSSQITDDQHSPYCGDLNKYSCYIREYTGYMALHMADTGPAGAAWAFNDEFRLKQVTPGDVKTCCGIANKMCYWLGCPMVNVETGSDSDHEKRVVQNKSNRSLPVNTDLQESLDS